jgi:hypothetical protein
MMHEPNHNAPIQKQRRQRMAKKKCTCAARMAGECVCGAWDKKPEPYILLTELRKILYDPKINLRGFVMVSDVAKAAAKVAKGRK